MNILEVDVPPQLEMKIKTGVGFFDDALGGGMTPSTAMLLSGTGGVGKTTLCMQVADRLTAQGHVVIFNSAEESMFQVRKVTKRIGCNYGFDFSEHTNVVKLIYHVAEVWKSQGAEKHCIIIHDSLQEIDDGTNRFTNSSQADAARMLTSFCKKSYAMAIIIGQVTKGGQFQGKNKVVHGMDVHAHMYIDHDKKSDTLGERLFEVNKNRFGGAGRAYILGVGEGGVYEKGKYEMCTR